MHKFGISLYPGHSTPEMDIEYIDLAHRYGVKRIFTCLLSVGVDKENILKAFKKTISYGKEKGMEVIADVSPEIFRELGISYTDLSFFNDMGVYGIRLDMGYSGLEEAMMTYNPYNLKIEVNMSNANRYIENLLSYRPNKENLLGCHNFYPHRYSGLSYDHFIKVSQEFKKGGIRTAAFVSSREATFGPWPVMEGLPTLELHRELPIKVQGKHLIATGVIDDIIISNCYASEEELKALTEINTEKLTFGIELYEGITDLEKKIVLEEPHFYRGDVSDYMIRSTQSRVKYKGEAFEPYNTRDIKRGDILIENDLYMQYAGELQIALKDMHNYGKSNVVGRIKEEEIMLLDYLKPWDKFAFIED